MKKSNKDLIRDNTASYRCIDVYAFFAPEKVYFVNHSSF